MQLTLLGTVALATCFTSAFSQSIDPNSVPLSTRDSWCDAQISQCPLICTQETGGSAATSANDCDADSLQYDCVCSNGLSPNASEYSQTIPYFICTQYNNDCVANCGLNNNACAAACVQNHPCGAQNPTRVNTSTITTTTSMTSTSANAAATTGADGSVVYSGFGGASATSTPASGSSHGSGAARIVGMGEVYGLGVVAASIFAGFTLLL